MDVVVVVVVVREADDIEVGMGNEVVVVCIDGCPVAPTNVVGGGCRWTWT